MKQIVIVGATSAIAQATARLYAEQGAILYLLARDLEKLARIQNDLIERGATAVHAATFDAAQVDFDYHTCVEAMFNCLSQVDVVFVAHGVLPDQVQCQQDLEHLQQVLQINALSVIQLLTLLANRLEQQGEGKIAVITSVAGNRGRQSNYIYGASKGMVSIFLQGLAHRLCPKGIQVLDVKLGFVDTPMTQAYKKGPLWAKPEKITEVVMAALASNKSTVYAPKFWWWIMLLIGHLPNFIFHRSKL